MWYQTRRRTNGYSRNGNGATGAVASSVSEDGVESRDKVLGVSGVVQNLEIMIRTIGNNNMVRSNTAILSEGR